MHQLFCLFQSHKHFFFRGGKAAQDPALHGDGALKFEGQAEIEDLAWHGAGQDNSSREQLGIIRGIPRVGFDKQRFCAVFLGNSRKHGILCGLVHQSVQHKAAGQKQAGTLHMLRQENYDNDLAVVNGHSYKDLKSGNTNLAILVSHNFTEPFNQPIAYAQKVGELTNMLGAGHILVQRYGDILDGKRTWAKELAHSNVRPTLKDAVAGDITAAMPYRAMVSIIEFIKMVDHVAPGFAAPETLLYSPELKFYSNKVKMDTDLETNISGLHCLGDSSGWTRGLMMASVMGVLMGRKLIENHDM